MDPKIEKLREEIAELEKLMEKDHFGGLFDKARQDKNYNRLKKLKKELKKLEDDNEKKGGRK
jgi:hypothetical protein